MQYNKLNGEGQMYSSIFSVAERMQERYGLTQRIKKSRQTSNSIDGRHEEKLRNHIVEQNAEKQKIWKKVLKMVVYVRNEK